MSLAKQCVRKLRATNGKVVRVPAGENGLDAANAFVRQGVLQQAKHLISCCRAARRLEARWERGVLPLLSTGAGDQYGVQTTPHRTHVCAHFSRCVPHFAQFIQCTCIGSRCLSDPLCVSQESSHPRPCHSWVFLISLHSLFFVYYDTDTTDWNQT